MSTQGSLFAVTTVYGLGDTSCYSCPFVTGIDTNAGNYSWRVKSKTAALVESYPVSSPIWIDNGKTSTYISYYPVVETGVPTDLTGYGDSYPPYTIDIDRIGTHVLGKPTTAKLTTIYGDSGIVRDAFVYIYNGNTFYPESSGEMLWLDPWCGSMYSSPIEDVTGGTRQFSAWHMRGYQWENNVYIQNLYNTVTTDYGDGYVETFTETCSGVAMWCGGYISSRTVTLNFMLIDSFTDNFIVDIN